MHCHSGKRQKTGYFPKHISTQDAHQEVLVLNVATAAVGPFLCGPSYRNRDLRQDQAEADQQIEPEAQKDCQSGDCHNQGPILRCQRYRQKHVYQYLLCPEHHASELSMPLQASSSSLTASTETWRFDLASSSSSISITCSTPFAPISTGKIGRA